MDDHSPESGILQHSDRMVQLRVVLVLAVVGALATVGLLQARIGHEPAPTSAPARSQVLDVLHGWDEARSRAWAAGDVAALRRLYVAGSVAGRTDVRLLRRYLARGLVVRHLRMQLFAVHLLQRAGGTLRVRVTDRVAGGVAVAAGRRLRLPGDTASTRTIVLRRVSGDWRVAAVR